MKGVIIAAGMGMRMRPLTIVRPKCMLPVGGRPLIESAKDNLRAAGCDEIIVIVGHMSEAVQTDSVRFVRNNNYENNNILHSLMCARDALDGPLICTYSDIWVEPGIYTALVNTGGDIVAAVDTDWKDYYIGRSEHPPEEAENAHFDADGRLHRFGKGLKEPQEKIEEQGEFLGLWRMSADGTTLMRETFDELDKRLDPEEPFQRARAWRIAYITDMFQELVDRGHRIDAALVERGWAELDTLQDYNRLNTIADRQRLSTLQSLNEESI